MRPCCPVLRRASPNLAPNRSSKRSLRGAPWIPKQTPRRGVAADQATARVEREDCLPGGGEQILARAEGQQQNAVQCVQHAVLDCARGGDHQIQEVGPLAVMVAGYVQGADQPAVGTEQRRSRAGMHGVRFEVVLSGDDGNGAALDQRGAHRIGSERRLAQIHSLARRQLEPCADGGEIAGALHHGAGRVAEHDDHLGIRHGAGELVHFLARRRHQGAAALVDLADAAAAHLLEADRAVGFLSGLPAALP